MNAGVFVLIFLSILKRNWCFDIAEANSDEQDGGVTEFPFGEAKVKYHRSRYCITAFGATNCVRMNEEPGNAAKLAKLYRIMIQGYQHDSAMLRMGKKESSKLSQKIKPISRQRGKTVNDGESDRLIKPTIIDETGPSKLSQHIKPRKMVQATKHSKRSRFVKPKKLSQEVKAKISKEGKPYPLFNFREFPYPSKMNQTVSLSKLITKKPKWRVVGVKPNHIPPIPRRNGY